MRKEEFIRKYNGKSIRDDITVISQDFKDFVKDYKKFLASAAQSCGMKIVSYSKGHYDIAAFLEQSGNYVYVSCSVPRGEMPMDLFSRSYSDGVLVRRAKDASDYTGGRNNFCSFAELDSMIKSVASSK